MSMLLPTLESELEKICAAESLKKSLSFALSPREGRNTLNVRERV